MATSPSLQCPVPLPHSAEITIGHGGGGKLTQDLINRVFRPAFAHPALDAQHDGAILSAAGARLAFTTDAHVVSPLFFPGGDIGNIAVNGTVNDLAMCGAKPLWLSAAFVIEEGLATATLERVAASMKAARRRRVSPSSRETRRWSSAARADGLYITTAGVGLIAHALTVAPSSIRPGDAVILSGDIGRHGMAIMATREGLAFENPIESDCAPVSGAVQALLDAGVEIHCLRDLTRGGLATALVELAETSRLSIGVEETLIRVSEPVRGACEILGLEPAYVANEGRFVCILPADQAPAALEIIGRTAPGGPPALIGRVRAAPEGTVTLRSVIGAERILDRLSGEQLPGSASPPRQASAAAARFRAAMGHDHGLGLHLIGELHRRKRSR